jgi:hypothetical protein
MTFAITESRVDEVELVISNLNSLVSQLTHIVMDNEVEQHVIIGTMSANFGAGVTLTLFLQSNDALDVSSDLNTYMGIKAVTVEVLP